MAGFLGRIGQMMDMAKALPRLKEEAERLQQRLAGITAEGDAGAGMVKVRVNGKSEVLACVITEEAFRTADPELLGEMVRGATNQALERVKQLAAEETQKMAANLGLPLGGGLPGLTPPGA
jgi:DNA-binding YbaB/EbfC family protein